MRALLPLVLSGLVACIDASNPPTDGEQGVLAFTDETNTPDRGISIRGLGRHVAVGSVVSVGVYGWDAEDGDLGGALLEGDAFEFVVDLGPVLQLRALYPGKVRVGVVTEDARQDEFELTAEVVRSAEILDHGFGLWTAPSPDLAAMGLSFLPGAESLLAVYTYGERGLLTGILPLSWTAPEGALIDGSGGGNVGALTANAVPGDHVITAGWDSTWTLHQLSADAPVTLALTTLDSTDPQPVDRIDATSSQQAFSLTITDPSGHYVMVPDGGLTLEVVDGPENLATLQAFSSTWPTLFATLCPGEGTVRLRVAGGSLDVPVSFPTPAEPVAGCP